ncbi:MAG: hypothetical protein FJ029_01110 [Actinobacteria bacterium]|nr:hypothetical protein [Actinomycetota bacterium]
MTVTPRAFHGVFPHLALFEPIEVLGTQLALATPEGAEPPWRDVLAVFRDNRGAALRAATCFTLRVEPGAEESAARHVQDLTALMGYLLLDPEHPASSPTAENLAVWLFDVDPTQPGRYLATPNFARYLEVDGATAIYPPTPDTAPFQDHINADAPALGLLREAVWRQPERARVRARILLAMYWYGRSFSVNPQEDDRTKVVHLATAFEVLLGIGIHEGKTRSLQAALQQRVGDDPLLAAWAEQFYDARSEIVHRGWTADLLFQRPQATRAHAPLIRSGQRIFRLAAEAELRQTVGGALAHTAAESFYRTYVQPDLEPNEARLVRLANAGVLRGEAARAFMNLVGELRLTDASGTIDQVVAVGRRLLGYFAETCLPGHRPHGFLRRALEAGSNPEELVHAYRELYAGLRDGAVAPYPVARHADVHLWRTDRALRHFAAYVQAVAPRMAARGRTERA